MVFNWLKRLVPRGLYGRAALILIVPIVTIQLVVSIVFLQRHFEGVTRQMAETVVLDLALVATRVAQAPDQAAAEAEIAALAGPLKLGVTLGGAETPRSARLFYDLSGREVVRVLYERLEGLRDIDLSNTRVVILWVDTPRGLLRIEFERRRISATNPHQLLVLMLATGLLMTLIAFIFLRNQLRPIKRLSRAAEAFGRGRVEPYRPTGATEVRSAGAAFLDMRDRIERQIEQRTMMLSGVSHDLRTPLTRLKLSLAMMPEDADVAAMQRDVADMEHLLNGFLDFARGDASEDAAVSVDPAALVADVVANARRHGAEVELLAPQGAGMVDLRPQAIVRALENLIGNAARYGTRARVSVTVSKRAVVISIEDDGPGIPKERRDEAMRPFARLDQARNQDKGPGVGLGLAIAADVARSHGGTLRLGESADMGGLKAELVLAR